MAACDSSSTEVSENDTSTDTVTDEESELSDDDMDEEKSVEEVVDEESVEEGESDEDDPATAAIQSRGPNGEAATLATELELTDEEIEKVREGNYTAAISMHYGGNDWATSQIEGIQDTFEKLNIEVVAVTDADFSAEKQVSDLETIMASEPDILIGIPTDATSTADAYRRVAESGTKIVFMDNVPNGFVAGENYISSVSADNYGNGVIAADLIGEALNGEGKIGVIFYDVDFFVTNQRLEAFEATMKSKYPDIEIVSKMGFTDENAGDVVADAMITQNPEIEAVFAHWDIPAEGAISALDAAGREDILVSSIDLGNNIARLIASGRVLGVGAQLPYDQGVAEATLAAYSLLEKEAPPYVAVPAQRVDQNNILEGYEIVYHVPAPDWLVEATEE